MFDIGFAELLIIGVVGLLVIGPERLPEAIRTGSAWLNRFRRSFNEIRDEVRRELHNDAVLRDLRETSDDLRRKSTDFKRQLESGLDHDISGSANPDTDRGAEARRAPDAGAGTGIANPEVTPGEPGEAAPGSAGAKAEAAPIDDEDRPEQRQ